MFNIPSDKWLGPSANKTLSSFLTLKVCLTLIKLHKTFHPQAVAKMRPVSGWRGEVTRLWQSFFSYETEYETISHWYWIVIGPREKFSVVFLFVQTLFTIFSIAGNQAVKPENWPDKVTRHLRDIDQWPEPGARGEDSWYQSSIKKTRGQIGHIGGCHHGTLTEFLA